MSLRLFPTWLTALVLLAGSVPRAAGGKPPDLPLRQVIICEVSETGTGSWQPGVGIDADAGLVGSLLLALEEVERLDVLPVEVEVLEVPPKEVGPEAGAGSACPYRPQTAVVRPAPSWDALPLERSVLDNLRRLEEAQRLYRQAESYRRRGEREQACRCYEQVRALCPGSRYDAQARACLQRLSAEAGAETSPPAGEEQEPVPVGPTKKPAASPGRDGPASPDGETVLRIARPLVDPMIELVAVEPPAGAEEQEQAPPSPNPSATREGEDPNLFLGAAGAPRFRDIANLLHDLLEAVPPGACLDFDVSQPGGLRACCRLQVGGIACRVVADHHGSRRVVISFVFP
jgi:hypothetical protein